MRDGRVDPPSRPRGRVGCLGFLLFCAALAIGGGLFAYFVAPWNFNFGGHFHPLGGWQGLGRFHSASGGGDYEMWVSFEITVPKRLQSPLSGTAIPCSPRGERLKLKLSADMPRATRRSGERAVAPLPARIGRGDHDEGRRSHIDLGRVGDTVPRSRITATSEWRSLPTDRPPADEGSTPARAGRPVGARRLDDVRDALAFDVPGEGLRQADVPQGGCPRHLVERRRLVGLDRGLPGGVDALSIHTQNLTTAEVVKVLPPVPGSPTGHLGRGRVATIDATIDPPIACLTVKPTAKTCAETVYAATLMSNPVATLVNGEIAGIAARLDGQTTKAGAWFDGFWDFFVENRHRLESGPAWEIQGLSGRPWAVEMIASDDVARPQLEVHLFVERKDDRPNVRKPWPVSSVAIGSADAAETGARDRFERPHDGALAEALRGRGFIPLIGYWGVRCEAQVARDDGKGLEAVRAMLEGLPEALRVALALADGL